MDMYTNRQAPGDQAARVLVSIPTSALAQKTGAAPITLSANLGAPVEPGRRIALALGDMPKSDADPAQYWIEYRHTSRFDQQINTPVGGMPDLPTEGVVVLHEVSFITQGYNGLHSFVRDWKGAQSGQRLPIPALGVAVQVEAVDIHGPSVVVSIVLRND